MEFEDFQYKVAIIQNNLTEQQYKEFMYKVILAPDRAKLEELINSMFNWAVK